MLDESVGYFDYAGWWYQETPTPTLIVGINVFFNNNCQLYLKTFLDKHICSYSNGTFYFPIFSLLFICYFIWIFKYTPIKKTCFTVQFKNFCIATSIRKSLIWTSEFLEFNEKYSIFLIMALGHCFKSIFKKRT